MDKFEEFEQYLRDALAHLHNPAYKPPELLETVTGYNPQQGLETFQTILIRAIEDLKPASDLPLNARAKRLHQLLSYRYVQVLTQEDTAQRLGITPRHLRREQQQAVHLLARRLWEQRPIEPELQSTAIEAPPTDDRTQSGGTLSSSEDTEAAGGKYEAVLRRTPPLLINRRSCGCLPGLPLSWKDPALNHPASL